MILAGGLSSRMGRSKAELKWQGTTMLEHQVRKLRSLGIEDIVVSGYPGPVEGTRFAPDKILLKGPLGGIHAGLCAAKEPHCLVMSVDTPLVPEKTLAELIRAHLIGSASITLLTHGEKIEPLMGVYERRLAKAAEEILHTENTSVRVLLRRVGFSRFEYTGDEALLCDCNTEAEYEAALQLNAER